MKISASDKKTRAQLVLLVGASVVLFALSFLPNSRIAVSSSEVHFSEISKHGLNIMPASCALNASYYHLPLSPTIDNNGFFILSGESERGAYVPSAGLYVCVESNASGNVYFIPAKTAAELQAFKNASAGLGAPTYTNP
jgi:hypothetical protein